MKQTHLVCDWCTGGARKPAIITLALSNGHLTRNTPTLDLCGSHQNELQAIFKIRKIARVKKKFTDASFASARAKHKKLWDVREKQVLDIFAKAKEPMTSKELRKLTRLNPSVRSLTLRRLLNQKKIKRTGWSKGTRWSLM